MKRQILFVATIFISLFSIESNTAPLEQTFYFPDGGIRVTCPAGWYARNESRNGFCSIFITREQITANSNFVTGLALYTNLEKIFGREFRNTDDVAAAVSAFSAIPIVIGKEFEIETSVGKFKAREGFSSNEQRSSFVQAVLKTPDNTYWINFEAPENIWEKHKRIFEKMVSSVKWNAKLDKEDEVIRSIYSEK